MATIAAPRQPKSILKKPTTARPPSTAASSSAPTSSSSTTPAKSSSAPTSLTTPAKPIIGPRAIAEQHARIIQQRRQLEDQVSDSLILLAKLPAAENRVAPYSAANPAPADAATFRTHVRLFQPGDYDDLIEERNSYGLCGYALCPERRAHLPNAGRFKLVNWGRKDFAIVPRQAIERWCSQMCARRAMYIKVQLNETAAWERIGIPTIQIDLYQEEKEQDAATRHAQDLQSRELNSSRQAARQANSLALERGDVHNKKETHRSVEVEIIEKGAVGEAAEPSLVVEDGHMILDGYRTKYGTTAQKADQSTTQ